MKLVRYANPYRLSYLLQVVEAWLLYDKRRDLEWFASEASRLYILRSVQFPPLMALQESTHLLSLPFIFLQVLLIRS